MTPLNAEHPDIKHWQHRFLQSIIVALTPGDEDEEVSHKVIILAATLALRQFVDVTTPPAQADGFVRNAYVHNHYVSPNRLSPSPKMS